jgi:peptide subunit release factor 1 (eRF1)
MRSRQFNKAGLYRFLSSLEASTEDVLNLYMTPDSFPDYTNTLSLGQKYAARLDEIKKAARTETVIRNAEKYGTGAALFWDGPGNKHIVLPPFPVSENKVSAGTLDVSILRETMEQKHDIAVVLVTWGWYALGIFDDGNLVASKIGTGHIHKKHKKGGSSQKRFARRTQEQRRDFLRRVGIRIDERFEGFAPDHIFFGGNRLILRPLIQESRYLQARSGKISPRVLDVRYADREALAGSLNDITSSLVFSF